MSPFKKFKKSYAPELLRIARGDWVSAKSLSQCEQRRNENIVFLAQQSVEKSIKSVLVHREIGFPLVHDLGALISLLGDSEPILPGGFDLLQLNPYATIRRYEEGGSELTTEEIQTSLEITEKVLDWAESIIN